MPRRNSTVASWNRRQRELAAAIVSAAGRQTRRQQHRPFKPPSFASVRIAGRIPDRLTRSGFARCWPMCRIIGGRRLDGTSPHSNSGQRLADVRSPGGHRPNEHRPFQSVPSCVSHPSATASLGSGDRRRGRSVENARLPVLPFEGGGVRNGTANVGGNIALFEFGAELRFPPFDHRASWFLGPAPWTKRGKRAAAGACVRDGRHSPRGRPLAGTSLYSFAGGWFAERADTVDIYSNPA